MVREKYGVRLTAEQRNQLQFIWFVRRKGTLAGPWWEVPGQFPATASTSGADFAAASTAVISRSGARSACPSPQITSAGCSRRQKQPYRGPDTQASFWRYRTPHKRPNPESGSHAPALAPALPWHATPAHRSATEMGSPREQLPSCTDQSCSVRSGCSVPPGSCDWLASYSGRGLGVG